MAEPAHEPWDGFHDAFWTLGQVILWVVTRDRECVDKASDRDGALGQLYAAAAAAVILDEIPRDQIEDSAERIRRLCAQGSLQATLCGRDIMPVDWTRLEIAFDDGMPFVRRRGQSQRLTHHTQHQTIANVITLSGSPCRYRRK